MHYSTADWTAHRLFSYTAIEEMLFHVDGRAVGYRLNFNYNNTASSSIVNGTLIQHQFTAGDPYCEFRLSCIGNVGGVRRNNRAKVVVRHSL
jgi:hypothetical protein